MQNSKRNLFTLVFVGGLLLALTLGCNLMKEISNSGQNASPDSSPTKTTAPSSSKGGLTKANFDRLEKGMTYSQAVEVIGTEGKKSGDMGDKETTGFKIEVYKWSETGSEREISVFFKDSKLDAKFQTGLE